jgi:dTMP kinase
MLFIVFEGIDGSGKSSQLQRFAQFCETALNTVPTTIRDPGQTPVSQKIREVLLDKTTTMHPLVQTLLFTAARASTIWDGDFRQNPIVLADRWFYSTLAYQCILGGVSPDLVAELHHSFCQNVRPHAYVLVDCPAEMAEARKKQMFVASGGEADRFESKGLEWHDRLRNAYLDLAGQSGKKFLVSPVITVNGAATIDAAAQQVVSGLIEHCPPFAKLLAGHALNKVPKCG